MRERARFRFRFGVRVEVTVRGETWSRATHCLADQRMEARSVES